MTKLPLKRTVGGCRAMKINYDTRGVVILKSQVDTKNSPFLVFLEGG